MRWDLFMLGAISLMTTVLLYGALLSISLSILIMAMLVRNPRLMLHSYPKDVCAAVAPKTPAERRESVWWAAIFLTLTAAFPLGATLVSKRNGGDFLETAVTAFGVVFVFNLIDWLVLDWLIFCTITPGFVVLPGTAGISGYKNYGMHLRGFMVGSLLSAVLGVVIATMVAWIPV
jgi:hypothetical protein